MTVLTKPQDAMVGATVSATTAPSDLSPERLAAANINPRTRLATDYLNHFNEVIMCLELAPAMPDMAEEILAWQEKSYTEHFAGSTFRERDLAVAAYHAADAGARATLEAIVCDLNNAIAEAKALVMGVAATDPSFEEEAMMLVVTRLRPLVDQASAVINGTGAHDAAADHTPQPTAQQAVDELFP